MRMSNFSLETVIQGLVVSSTEQESVQSYLCSRGLIVFQKSCPFLLLAFALMSLYPFPSS